MLEAKGEADQRGQPEHRQQRGSDCNRLPLDDGSFLPTRGVQADPGRGEDDGDDRVRQPQARVAADKRPSTYGAMAISAAPRRRAPTSDQAAHGGGVAAEHGHQPEHHGPERDRPEAGS